MAEIKFYSGKKVPVEMHKVRIVQKLNLLSVEERKKAMTEAGFNTFLLKNRDVFMDMLTDSGVNAMSDRQQAAMMLADDSYAGSATYDRLEDIVRRLFGMDYFLPAHQGRACENIISQVLVKEGSVVPMNYHFTTTKSHIERNGGRVEELIADSGLEVNSTLPFKGDMDIDKLKASIETAGSENIAFVRLEAGTNLIGGQPVSIKNIKEVRKVCDEHNILLVMDASLLADNLYFIKTREAAYQNADIEDIVREIADQFDILYFSGRKLGCSRGGGICIRSEEVYSQMRELVPLYEGFLTYGGMSVREMEALVVGLEETMDEDMISQGPQFIAYMAEELQKKGIPVITPPGGLGCHINAMEFVNHIPQEQYPAGALAAAIYIASGARGMERGTLSEDRNPDGSEHLSNMELVRMAMPRRVFTMSQVDYIVDRIAWLYENRELIGGLRFTDEPKIMRFFIGRLEETSDWPQKLVEKFQADFGESL